MYALEIAGTVAMAVTAEFAEVGPLVRIAALRQGHDVVDLFGDTAAQPAVDTGTQRLLGQDLLAAQQPPLRLEEPAGGFAAAAGPFPLELLRERPARDPGLIRFRGSKRSDPGIRAVAAAEA
jgi:hypothetical protein